MAGKKPCVDVIIVSHNNKDILKENIDSIYDQSYKNIKIYLADNDSSDGTAEFIKKNYQKVNFIDIPLEGPSKKRNIVINKSKSEYIVTMDSDAVLSKNWIETAVEYMEEHESVGACGGKMLETTGLINSAGCICAKNGGCIDIGHQEKDRPEFNHLKMVSTLSTASLMIRRKMIEEIGGFDDDYFYGYEDTDLGIRANIAGWKYVYNPDLIAVHKCHVTISKKQNSLIGFFLIRNRIITLLKNYEGKTILFNLHNIIGTIISPLLHRPISPAIKSYFWIIKNYKKIMKSRKNISKIRKLKDKQIFDKIYYPGKISGSNKQNKINNFLRKIRSSSMENVTFFITAKCNSKCKHCFYWKSLNQEKDLSLEDIKKIVSKFYNLKTMTLSGGEPFIRKDIDKIIKLIVKYTDIKTMSIPTNCIIDITDKLEKILKENPEVNFAVVCSLDGLKKDHDFIRGIKGSFDKTVKQIKKLEKVRKENKNLVGVGVNTVITNENYSDISKLIRFVKTLPVTGHSFDVLRGEHQGVLHPPSSDKLKEINRIRLKTSMEHDKKSSLLRWMFYYLKNRELMRIQANILKKKKWPFECTAGLTDFVIESDGTGRICELLPKVGSLLKNTPEELQKNKISQKMFREIKNHKCDCSHICNLYSSSNHSIKNFLWDRQINFLLGRS